MASKSNHEIVTVYRYHDEQGKPTNIRYYITKNDRVLRSDGPKGGNAKVLMMRLRDNGSWMFSYSTIGPDWKRASAKLWIKESLAFKHCAIDASATGVNA